MYRNKVTKYFYKLYNDFNEIKERESLKEILKYCKEDADDYCERYDFYNKDFWQYIFLQKLTRKLLFLHKTLFSIFEKPDLYEDIEELEKIQKYYNKKVDEFLDLIRNGPFTNNFYSSNRI